MQLAGVGFIAAEEPVVTVTPEIQTPAPAVPRGHPGARPRAAYSSSVSVPFSSSFKPPPGLSRSKACRGIITSQLKAGRRLLATKKTRVDRRCRYATRFRIARASARGRSVLAVVVRFRGNRYLAPTRATYQVRVPAT